MAKKKTKKPAKKAAKKTSKKKVTKRPSKKVTKKKPAKKTAKKKAVKPTHPAGRKASKKPVASSVKPVTTISPYLNYNGNCEEAFNFYKSVFGGKFAFVGRFKDMPPIDGKSVSAAYGEKIMHMSLPISKETTLSGSDSVEGFGPPLQKGNNFTIAIDAASKSEADRWLFNGLSAGGNVGMPMGDTFWGSYFGMFIDKFGISWMVSFERNEKNKL